MSSSGDEITYTFSGAKETEDISDVDEIILRSMRGADGRQLFSGDFGGAGGLITNARVDVAGKSTLEVWVGEHGGNGNEYFAGFGRSTGGQGGQNFGGGGGGSTELVADGTFIAAADAGGGSGNDEISSGYGGGGGGRGGVGGAGGEENGTDAGGTGFGGDGGDDSGSFPSVPGQDGGAELGAAQLLSNGSKTDNSARGFGGGLSNERHGELTLAFDKPFSPTITSLNEDLSVVGPSVTVDVSNETTIKRVNTIYRSAVSSPTFPNDFAEAGSVGKGETTVTDSPPDFETTYTYRATASVNGGESEPSAPVTITTSSAGELRVTITGTNSPVTVGDTLDLDVEVENIGDYRADKTLDADLEAQ